MTVFKGKLNKMVEIDFYEPDEESITTEMYRIVEQEFKTKVLDSLLKTTNKKFINVSRIRFCLYSDFVTVKIYFTENSQYSPCNYLRDKFMGLDVWENNTILTFHLDY